MEIGGRVHEPCVEACVQTVTGNQKCPPDEESIEIATSFAPFVETNYHFGNAKT